MLSCHVHGICLVGFLLLIAFLFCEEFFSRQVRIFLALVARGVIAGIASRAWCLVKVKAAIGRLMTPLIALGAVVSRHLALFPSFGLVHVVALFVGLCGGL